MFFFFLVCLKELSLNNGRGSGQPLGDAERELVWQAALKMKRATGKLNWSELAKQTGFYRITIKAIVEGQQARPASATAAEIAELGFALKEPTQPAVAIASDTQPAPDIYAAFMEFAKQQGWAIQKNVVNLANGEPEEIPPPRLNQAAPAPAIIGSETVNCKDVYRVIVTPDCQLPYEDPIAMRAVEMYVADNRFDEWVDLGDFMDFDFLSRHNEGKHRLNANKLLKEHYDYGKMVLDRRLRVLHKNNPDAKMTMIEGNHDYRAEAFLDKNPNLEGMLEVEQGLGLKERGIQWIRFWRDGTAYRIGKALFVHGRYCSKYHAAKMVETYMDSVFYGHTHDVQEFPKVAHGRDKVIVGHSLGCLCRYDQAYIKENPKNWQQAFAEFYFLPTGHFTYYVPRIIQGRFVAPNGKIYDGNKDGAE